MNKKISLSTTVFLCILTAAVAFMSAWTITRGKYVNELNKFYLDNPEAMKLAEIASYFENFYVGEYDPALSEKLALQGYVFGTEDRYGVYYTPEEFAKLLKEEDGEMVGVGLMVSYEEKGIKVVRVIPASPAAEGGLLKGDYIVGVGELGIEAGTEALSNAILGKEGEPVAIKILRNGEEFTVTLTRRVIKTDSVVSGYIENEKLGFIRILTFDNTTPEQFETALKNLKEMGAEKFIFDLRDNGGGLVSSLQGVLGKLLPKDTLIATANPKNGEVKEYKVDGGEDFDFPAVVLVNKNTASAAELFTAALRDYGKVKVIGENTFGKGVMQSLVTLSDGSGLKITTAYYQSPNGINYDGVGIKPDIDGVVNEGDIEIYELDTNDTVIKKAIDYLTNG